MGKEIQNVNEDFSLESFDLEAEGEDLFSTHHLAGGPESTDWKNAEPPEDEGTGAPPVA